MRCTKCKYQLWNLPAGACPECGPPFKPSQFRFRAHRVRFCCAHCGQDYYGDDVNGHLDPIEFDCVCCGRHIHMDETILQPAKGVSESQTRLHPLAVWLGFDNVVPCPANPWLQRKQIGLIKAARGAIQVAMRAPRKLMAVTAVDSSTCSAFGLAALLLLAFSLTGPGSGVVLMSLGQSGGIGAAECLLAWLIFLGLMYLWMILWAFSAHAILMLSGPRQDRLRRTMQAICYSSGANVFLALPIVGFYMAVIGWIWWLVSATHMLSQGQGVSMRRAYCATLALPGSLLLMLMTLSITMALVAQVNAPPRVTWVEVPAIINAQYLPMAQAIHRRALDPTLPPLRHGLELFLPASSASLKPAVLARWEFQPEQIQVGDQTLEQLLTLDDAAQRQAVQTARDSLPPDVIAHWLGDMVFTWHGIDVKRPDAGPLWVAIIWRSPGVDGPQGAWPVHVLRADGMVQLVARSTTVFQPVLDQQNELRATFGLPPLPNPGSVTHDRPAVAAEASSNQ